MAEREYPFHDIADRTARKTGIAADYEVKASALRAEQFVRADFTTPPGITHAIPRNVRRQQCIEVQLAAQRFVPHLKPGVHEKHRPVRISQNLFDDLIATVALGIYQAIKKTAAFRVINTVVQVTLFLVAKRLAVTDEKFKMYWADLQSDSKSH